MFHFKIELLDLRVHMMIKLVVKCPHVFAMFMMAFQIIGKSQAFEGLTVRVSVEPEDTCLDAEIRERFAHRHEVLKLDTPDSSMACKRHRERCSPW